MWLVETRNPLQKGRHIWIVGLIGATSALAQTTPVETLIRQHERAVQDVNQGNKDWFEIVVAHYYFHHGEDDEAKVKLVYEKGKWTSVNLLEKP
jgi:hypothetical protein